MKKKLLPLAIGCLLSIVACGPQTHVVDQDLPDDDPTSEVEIIFWHCMGHDKSDAVNEIVAKEFNETWAGKYHVKTVKLAGDYTGLHDAAKTKMSSGEIPALAMGYPDSFSEYMTEDLSTSQILRLDNFLNNEKFGYTAGELADFVPGYYGEGNKYQHSGTWSMPMYKSTEVMYYNYSYMCGVNKQNVQKFSGNAEFQVKYDKVAGTSAAKEADLQDLKTWVKEHDGYTYEIPEHWTDWIALGRKMIDDRAAQGLNMDNDEFYPIGYDSDANLMISQMRQRNIGYTTRDGEGGDHFLFHNSENKSKTEGLITEITTLIADKVMITKNSLGGSKYTNTYFNDGKLAMTVGSTGGSSYNISSNFVVKLAAVPYSGSQPYYIQQGPSICFFDNEDPYMHKGAWLFYKALAEAANNCTLALENSYDPVRISSYDTDEYKQWISRAGQGLKYDIPKMTSTLKEYYMTSDVFIGSSTARNEIGNTITYVTGSGYSVEDAVEAAYQACLSAAI